MADAAIMEERGTSPTLRPFLLAKRLLVSALLRIPLYGLLAMAVLVPVASAFPFAGGDQGTWSVVAGWSLTGLYAVAGLIGGGLIGALAAAARTFSAVESGIRDRLQQWHPTQDSSSFPSLPLHQVRERYDQVIEQMYAGTLGRMRLPGFLERFVRSRFRQAYVEDFISDFERRGVSRVGLPEIRQWLVTKNLPKDCPIGAWRSGTPPALPIVWLPPSTNAGRSWTDPAAHPWALPAPFLGHLTATGPASRYPALS